MDNAFPQQRLLPSPSPPTTPQLCLLLPAPHFLSPPCTHSCTAPSLAPLGPPRGLLIGRGCIFTTWHFVPAMHESRSSSARACNSFHPNASHSLGAGASAISGGARRVPGSRAQSRRPPLQLMQMGTLWEGQRWCRRQAALTNLEATRSSRLASAVLLAGRRAHPFSNGSEPFWGACTSASWWRTDDSGSCFPCGGTSALACRREAPEAGATG